MPIIRNLSKVLNEFPDYNPGWSSLDEALLDGTTITTGFHNPSYGRVTRVVICDDKGKPIYDLYQVEEGPTDEHGIIPSSSGSVIVPYFNDNDMHYVGLLHTVRGLVIDPETNQQGHFISTELPMGFSSLDELPEETAMRELGEETHKFAKNLHKLGRINPNTAFYTTSGIPVYAAEVEPSVGEYPISDSEEPILKCEFLPYPDVRGLVRDQKIICASTLSGLMMFDTHLESLREWFLSLSKITEFSVYTSES